MSPLILSIVSTLLISLVSLVGIAFFIFKVKHLDRLTPILVSLAAGSLLGDAFIHIIPTIFQSSSSPSGSLLIISGILLFFVVEKFLNWRHCHNPECLTGDDHHQSSPAITLNLIGDSVHNFIDGLLIAASFLTSFNLGLATALAVLAHEIPQEIGDFGILIHHRLTVSKALFLNFLTALFSILGVLVVFLLGSTFSYLPSILLPITAGGFIYLAGSDLIPELHRHSLKAGDSLHQLFFILLGITLMYLLTFLEN